MALMRSGRQAAAGTIAYELIELSILCQMSGLEHVRTQSSLHESPCHILAIS
jgi:hypothetical protein